LGLIHLVALDLDPLLHLAAEQQAWLEQDLAAAAANRASKMKTPSYPRSCPRALIGCFVPFKNFKKGWGEAIHQGPLGAVACCLSLSADVRSADDVIAF